jgi:hypothetical protein
VVREEQPENSILLNQELSDWMLSITSHDGSFDDILDDSRCFSILFPYEIEYDGAIRDIQSVNDLLGLEEDLIEGIQFPVTVTFANYMQNTITSAEELTTAISTCQSNTSNINSIRCRDFMYPVRIAVFNTTTDNFETIVVDHDRQTFLSVSDFIATQRASLNFPVQMQLTDGSMREIASVAELEVLIATHSEECNG